MKRSLLSRTFLLLITLTITIGFNLSQTPGRLNAQESYKGLGKESVSPAILERYAPKPPDPEIAARVESILDVRSPGSGMLTPDGKHLFFNWGVTGVSHVWRMDEPMGFPLQMTGGKDETSLEDISPKGNFLLISRDRQGEENPGLYIQDVRGGPLQVIQHQPKVQTIPLYISDDERSIYFAANDVKPDSYTIYRYDLSTQKKQLLLDRPGRWFISDVRPDGRFLMVKQIGNFAREYYEFDEKTQELKPLLGVGENKDYRAQYGAKPGELLVQTPEMGEFYRVYSYINGKFTPITPKQPIEIEDFAIDQQRQRIVYTLNDRGYGQLKALDAQTFQPIELPEFQDALQVRMGSMTRNGRFMSLAVDKGKAPANRYVFDWQTKQLTQWTLPSIPEMNSDRFVTPVLESYPARDGTKIPMFVWRSQSCQEPCPIVVHFHGGPESQSVPSFNRLAQLFVQNGFTYVEPNVRGSSGYGKTWLNADNGSKRLETIADIADCALYMRSAWQVNGKAPKIGIMGWSYGGYATLMGMTKFAGSYDAGVAIVGMSNLVTFLENTAPYRRQVRVLEYGDPVRDREALMALSPITYIDNIKAPLLTIQGVNDPRVPVGEALQIQAALEKRKIPSQLIVFPDEGHGASTRANQVLEIGNTIDFFRQHLLEPSGDKQPR